ncbi:SIR2 family protein [candidate division KSB1 bacterium]|nr:SIR2 family protein [candidate division KSB1 bacterium]
MLSFKENDLTFLLGAGASADAKIPISSEMVSYIEKDFLPTSESRRFKDLYYLIKSGFNYSAGLSGKTSTFNIETLLFVLEELVQKEKHLLYPFIGSWNVRFNEVVKDDFKLIEDFQKSIKKKLKEWVTKDDYRDADYFKYFKQIKNELTFPIRIFTLNYDKCIEENSNNIGFEFTYERGFDNDSRKWNHKRFTERVKDDEPDIYLYKLHGSIDWKRDFDTGIVKYVNREPVEPDLIFGTQNKLHYSDPYLFLFSEFRHYTLNAKLIICIGYSYSDSHINGLIEQALKQNKYSKLLSVSLEASNDEEIKQRIAGHIGAQVDRIHFVNENAKSFIGKKLTREYFSSIFPETENDYDSVF